MQFFKPIFLDMLDTAVSWYGNPIFLIKWNFHLLLNFLKIRIRAGNSNSTRAWVQKLQDVSQTVSQITCDSDNKWPWLGYFRRHGFFYHFFFIFFLPLIYIIFRFTLWSTFTSHPYYHIFTLIYFFKISE